ncbi:MAG: SIMPL domain-containing protein, partial [Planctomycetota bacterium]|nr:SIMPL domain-containing protein [Planctomycetota bacterium]
MEYSVKLNNLKGITLIVVLGFAISLITSTVVASQAYTFKEVQHAKQSQSMTVKGYARRRISSDLGVWRVAIYGEHSSLSEAYKKIEACNAQLRELLTDQGFQKDEIMVNAIQTNTHYKRDKKGIQTREIVSYSLSQQFVMTSKDVQKIWKSTGEVTSLIKNGHMIHSSPAEFTISTLGQIKVDILGEASADARKRAEAMTVNTGCAIENVKSVRMGVLQITRPHSTDVSSYGIYSTSTIEKDAAVVVTVTFGVGDPK